MSTSLLNTKNFSFSLEYLSSTDNGNIELIADAEVWITFVHEGAGYKNALGYYTHKNDNHLLVKLTLRIKLLFFKCFLRWFWWFINWAIKYNCYI
jgi:hypothetical protein